MTLDLEQIKRLLAEATPGPWREGARKFNDGVYAGKGDTRVAGTHGAQRNFDRDAQIAEQNSNRALIALTPALAARALSDAERIAELEAAHRENERVLGYLVNELQGRIEAGKLIAVDACRNRSRNALEGEQP